MKYLVLVCLLSSCGFEHEVTGLDQGNVNVTGTVGPDYKGVSQECNKRYGDYTEESNQCFELYLEAAKYSEIKISIDTDTIREDCERRYQDIVDQYNCEDRMYSILENLNEV